MADLLLRRMLALQLDKDEIVRLEPVTFGELQTLCAHCEGRERCEVALADDFADVALARLLSERRHADGARRIVLVSNCSCLIAGAGGGRVRAPACRRKPAGRRRKRGQSPRAHVKRNFVFRWHASVCRSYSC